MTTDVTAAAGAPLIHNPVLPGFRPDPSILRVGEDYYVATSTFEWYPGVGVHHSRDLVHWRPLGGILTERRLLDLTGDGDGCGIWAPALSFADGRFYLVFTPVHSYGNFWDAPNYVTTAEHIEGPWSDPVPLHAIGFDASLFHDEDGRSWLLSSTADFRPGRHPFLGISVQEFDRHSCALLGEAELVFPGTEARLTEGPHLYRRDGWYYLVTAEGGTQWEHQVTVARSRSLHGPYEVDPAGPMLSSWAHPELTLQKAGHGSLVATPAGEWYLAHLVGRPSTERGHCLLGRETALQQVAWPVDGWPRIAGGVPHDVVPAPDLPSHPWPQLPAVDDFDAPVLGPQWSTLRRPATQDWLSLTERPGHLRVYGGESPQSRHRASLVGRRMESRTATFAACVDAEPTRFQHVAGATAYYNTRDFYHLHVTVDEELGRVLRLLRSDHGVLAYLGEAVPLPAGPVTLSSTVDGDRITFGYQLPDGEAVRWPGEYDATILSDEHALADPAGGAGFTGAFFGLWCYDLTGGRFFMDVDWARYEEKC
jgi:xylan 1,4-beta-xylosidase